MKTKIKADTRQLVNQAWTRDGKQVLTGNALILACLLHTHADERAGMDLQAVQELMDDINLKEKR